MTSRPQKGVYDGTFDAGVALNWTLFDGFRIRADYRKLQELKEKGALQTRLTIEDFIASFTAEYYNFVQQTLRLENFRYAMALSRERLRIAEAWYHVGSSAQLDVLQARVDFNADSSQYMSQQEAVVASRIRINELLANEEPGPQVPRARHGHRHRRRPAMGRPRGRDPHGERRAADGRPRQRDLRAGVAEHPLAQLPPT